MNLQEEFGNMDIYIFDQLLKGRFQPGSRLLDVGCGRGRNLVYFLRNGFGVFGIDQQAEAVEAVQRLSQQLAPANPASNFCVAEAEKIPFADDSFDIVICNAVLHFAQNQPHFDQMLHSIWRVLAPGGFLFVRLASDIGIEHLVQPLGDGRYYLPDGSERFLVNEEILLQYTKDLGGQLLELIKTTNVQNLRCMTTWCMQKG